MQIVQPLHKSPLALIAIHEIKLSNAESNPGTDTRVFAF